MIHDPSNYSLPPSPRKFRAKLHPHYNYFRFYTDCILAFVAIVASLGFAVQLATRALRIGIPALALTALLIGGSVALLIKFKKKMVSEAARRDSLAKNGSISLATILSVSSVVHPFSPRFGRFTEGCKSRYEFMPEAGKEKRRGETWHSDKRLSKTMKAGDVVPVLFDPKDPGSNLLFNETCPEENS